MRRVLRNAGTVLRRNVAGLRKRCFHGSCEFLFFFVDAVAFLLCADFFFVALRCFLASRILGCCLPRFLMRLLVGAFLFLVTTAVSWDDLAPHDV